MKSLLLLGLLCAGLTRLSAMAETNTIANLAGLEAAGRFREAAAEITAALSVGTLPADETRRLAFERERLDRIRLDYSDTRAELFHDLQAAVRDLTSAEFDDWVKADWFDSREIDGTVYFFSSGVSNLFFRHPELNSRRLKAADPAPREQLILGNVRSIRAAAREAQTPYVLPRQFHVTMKVTVKSNAVPAGEPLRVWLPIPRRYPFQSDFKLLGSSLPFKSVAAEDSPIRSVYFEQPALGKEPTEFKIDYEFTTRGVSFQFQPERVRPPDLSDPVLKRFTSEGPHVRFTPQIRELAGRIVGEESNPLLQARAIYNWMADHLLYSYALEYSTIPNLSEYCRSNGYGDCGQQALLFITLCRSRGIPARWQSGWNLLPGDTTNHDWAEIYLAPYGWVPVDSYMGNFAMRYVRTLPEAQKREIRDFYFGGLDHYRMAANADHSAALEPAKNSFRSDDVDFQRGEIEAGGKNLYFNKFSYHLDWHEVTAP